MERDNKVRKAKLASLLQGIAAKFFTEEGMEWGLNAMVMVDHVFMAADLKSAQIWVSFSPHKPDRAAKLFERVEPRTRDLQNYLFSHMIIRRVPRVSLHLSDPDKTFKIIDIFGTLEDHAGDQQPDSSDTSE